MQTITQTVVGAQTLQFNINGKYFTILATTLGLNVRFYRGGKKLDLGDIKALLAGLEVSFDANDAFDRVEIDTLGADTFVIGLSNGQSRYNRSQGNVAVTGGALTTLGSITNTVNILEQPQVYGASFRSIANLAANTPEVVFTPAANINGAIIHSMQFFDKNGGTICNPAYLAKTSAPTTVTDGDAILSTDNYIEITGSLGHSASLKKPIKIASGKGLYFITNALQSNANRSVLYTLL